MRRLLSLCMVVGLLVTTGCSDDGPQVAGGADRAVPDRAVIGRAVDSGFRPERDGFAFANFGHTAYPQRFTVEDLLETVGGGPRVCRDALTDPCVPTAEAQIFIDTVESARRAGHCEGMVVLAAVRHQMGLAPATADLPPSDRVVDAIIRAFSTMFLPEVQAATRAWSSLTVEQDVALLAEALEAGRLDYGMGLYTELGGHEVLPYAIEYPDATTAQVWVYDPNWPLVPRWVEIDLSAGTWRFSFAGEDPTLDPHAWTGDRSMIDLNSIAVRALALEARGVDLTPR